MNIDLNVLISISVAIIFFISLVYNIISNSRRDALNNQKETSKDLSEIKVQIAKLEAKIDNIGRDVENIRKKQDNIDKEIENLKKDSEHRFQLNLFESHKYQHLELQTKSTSIDENSKDIKA